MRRAASCAAAVGVLGLVSLGLGARRDEEETAAEVGTFTLNALDHRLNIFELREGRHGYSKQLNQDLRLYAGDVLFTGDGLLVLENERYTGHFLDLGEEKRPDSEFSLFHGLRIYKRNFQLREFPFLDRFLPQLAIDSRAFFTNQREPLTSVRLSLGHVYLARLHHRTTVSDERVFLLKVIELVPGVKVTALWRELELSNEP
ncbi:MAG: hypothetical protein HY721_28370 [Planctomycetes bacterium]|nr:hypothetical protein [Planctomycetota bacterium]